MTTARKALVLGGNTGLVGQALTKVLSAAGWDVTAAGRSDFDMTRPNAADKIQSLVDAIEPDCLFNAMGYTQVDAAEDDKETATLLNRSLPSLLGRTVQTRPCMLIHYSTDFVFDGKKSTPYTVEDAPHPLCVYGKTKWEGEEVLLSLDLPRFLIIRTAWLFGPGRRNFVSAILQQCAEKRELAVVHDQTGSPTYTPDLAFYTMKLVEANARGLFHIVNSGQARWVELADEAVRLSQTECMVSGIPSSAYPQKARRPGYSVLDCNAFTKVTGLVPRPWPQALCDYIYRDLLPE